VLSAILCLIKEIDGPSLEVVEMAVRYTQDILPLIEIMEALCIVKGVHV
jgi:hypothetical protein